MERVELLRHLLHETYNQELTFVDELDPAERERIGTFENWSARDMLAHNAAWKQSLADELAAASRGEPSSRGDDFDYHAENAHIFKTFEGQSWPQISAVVEGAHESLLAQLDALSDDDLARCDLLPWQGDRPVWRLIAGNGVLHPRIHLSEAHQKLGAVRRAAETIAAMAESMAGLDPDPAWQGTARYNRACSEALLGETTAALASLREALTLNPGLVQWSREDPDLASLRDLPEYAALYDELE